MNKKTKALLIGLAFGLGVVGLAFLSKAQRWHYSFHRSWESPDGQYVVNLYRNNLFGMIPGPPGGGSDAPGLVELVDLESDEVIAETEIEMVQQLLSVRWDDYECWLSGVHLSWPLPRALSWPLYVPPMPHDQHPGH